MARITTVEELRRIIPEPRPATKYKILDRLDEQASDFVRASPFALLSTVNAGGQIEVSPKGDEPGFMRIEDDRTLLMPERTGNNLAFGLQNIFANGRVGLIFLCPNTGETLRVSGSAEVFDDADLLGRLGSAGRPALLAIRIHIEKCYFHCARAILRSQLWQPQSWPEKKRISFGKIIAPRAGGTDDDARQIDANVESAYGQRLWSNG